MPLICIPLISQAKDLALARERLSLEVHLESEASRNTEAESLWYEVKGGCDEAPLIRIPVYLMKLH